MNVSSSKKDINLKSQGCCKGSFCQVYHFLHDWTRHDCSWDFWVVHLSLKPIYTCDLDLVIDFSNNVLGSVHTYPFLFEHPANRVTENGTFQKRFPEWKFLKTPFSYDSVDGWKSNFKNVSVMAWYPTSGIKWRKDISLLYRFFLGFFKPDGVSWHQPSFVKWSSEMQIGTYFIAVFDDLILMRRTQSIVQLSSRNKV